MVKLSESDEKIGIAGSKLLYYDKPNIIQALGWTSQITWRSFGTSICSFEKDQIKFNNNFEIKGSLIGASLLVKKEVIETMGIFDENYFLYAEETDCGFRASKIGWKLLSRIKLQTPVWKCSGSPKGSSSFFACSQKMPLAPAGGVSLCSGKSKIWHKIGNSSGKSVQKVFLGRQSISLH